MGNVFGGAAVLSKNSVGLQGKLSPTGAEQPTKAGFRLTAPAVCIGRSCPPQRKAKFESRPVAAFQFCRTFFLGASRRWFWMGMR